MPTTACLQERHIPSKEEIEEDGGDPDMPYDVLQDEVKVLKEYPCHDTTKKSNTSKPEWNEHFKVRLLSCLHAVCCTAATAYQCCRTITSARACHALDVPGGQLPEDAVELCTHKDCSVVLRVVSLQHTYSAAVIFDKNRPGFGNILNRWLGVCIAQRTGAWRQSTNLVKTPLLLSRG